MAYRDDGRFQLSKLKAHELLAFGALMRTILAHGGYHTPEMQRQVQDIGEQLDPALFWDAIYQAREVLTPEEVEQLAVKVKRSYAHQLIFAVLSEVAMVGSITPGESALLDGLQELWGITIQDVPNR